jgi:hypothetical protein
MRRALSPLALIVPLALALLVVPLAGCRKSDKIPDGQGYERYESAAGGYAIDAPKGWSRNETPPAVAFTEGRKGMSVGFQDRDSAPTAATVRDNEAKALESSGREVKVTSVEDVTLPAGPAVVIKYTSLSEPEAISGKQVPLQNETVVYYTPGKLVSVTFWSPREVDNQKHWDRMAQSFGWL